MIYSKNTFHANFDYISKNTVHALSYQRWLKIPFLYAACWPQVALYTFSRLDCESCESHGHNQNL